jgi:hypothetical protein
VRAEVLRYDFGPAHRAADGTREQRRSPADGGGYGRAMKKLLILSILVALGAVASKKLKEL